MKGKYQDWLVAQGYNENTCNTQMAHIRAIEKHYGELLPLLSDGGLDKLVEDFTYSKEDERAGRPNPSKVDFSGRVYTRLQSLKGALRRYARFVSEGFDPELDEPTPRDPTEHAKSEQSEKQRFALERDMQAALRRNISALEIGLTIIDDGAERSVDSGFIDILCEDPSGQMVVIELKAGKTDSRVVGQILGYMGDLIAEDEPQAIRGVIVAHSFDKRTLAAARAIPNLRLVTYAIEFSFEALS
ncbi:endonuclease NucS domain-containing protein [Ruegeria sp. 6PALISEP08]|uniref:endonuclease NucS domain-containing protein n=1 Tax=Ruegeria sp. 6PALISEP08 TaxID=1225660 RepID=UPI00067F4E36|nr:endonuclease NucS domain-containing protein [Ruegeria sp. 6PALISEP08]